MAAQNNVKTRLARNFVESRGAAIHPVFGVPAHFDMSSSSYGPEAVCTELHETINKIKEKGEILDVDFDIRQCTWDHVLAELERAQEADEKRGKKWSRKAWRALGSAAAVFGPGLSAIPDELCVLHGGLALLFSIASRRAQHRSKILAAFEDIPQTIIMAREKARIFPRDEANAYSIRLHNSIDSLSQTLLQVLPDLIRSLNPDTFVSRVTSGLRGDRIDNLLDCIMRSSKYTRECAEHLADHTIVDIHTRVKDHQRFSQDIHTTVKDHEQVSQYIHADTQNIVTGVDDLGNLVGELLRRQQTLQDSVDAISGKNGLFQFVLELLNNPLPNISSPPPEYTPTAGAQLNHPDMDGGFMTDPAARVATTESGFTAVQLINLIEVQPYGPIDEETQILRRGRSIDDELIRKACYMLQTPQVIDLLRTPQKRIVLVDGCSSVADRAQMGSAVTPVSFICATLASALRRGMSSSSGLVLVFFCGLHVASQDVLRGPLGLVRSLLAQLVLELHKKRWVTGEDPLRGVTLPNDENPGEEGGVGGGGGGRGVYYLAEFCSLFHQVLRLVPPETSVYCIIDGVSCYYERGGMEDEEENWREDWAVVMEAFAAIAEDDSLAARFKLLMTCMSRTTPGQGLARWIAHNQRVSLGSGRTGGGSVQSSVRAALRAVDLNEHDQYY